MTPAALANAIDPRIPMITNGYAQPIHPNDLIAASDFIRAHAWRPIAEAPKDDTEIIVCFRSQQNVRMIYRFNTLHKRWESKGDPRPGLEYQDVVWQPLPAAPGGGR